QLEGVSMASATIPLTSGFELRRFDGDAWEALRSNVNHEQLNPDIIAEQVFLTREGTHVMPPRQLFYSPPKVQDPPERDVLWDEWWQPLLALALFMPEDFAVGVRLEITPKWRLRKNGDFSGDFLPLAFLHEDEPAEEIFERWHNSIPDTYN